MSEENTDDDEQDVFVPAPEFGEFSYCGEKIVVGDKREFALEFDFDEFFTDEFIAWGTDRKKYLGVYGKGMRSLFFDMGDSSNSEAHFDDGSSILVFCNSKIVKLLGFYVSCHGKKTEQH
ncbi:hypothetical protein J5690_03850, partial [bacterium]|nr:hypothetical protein [bacterium]